MDLADLVHAGRLTPLEWSLGLMAHETAPEMDVTQT
jgi:hypothetical protein